jgi:hypothetical protein
LGFTVTGPQPGNESAFDTPNGLTPILRQRLKGVNRRVRDPALEYGNNAWLSSVAFQIFDALNSGGPLAARSSTFA